MGRNFGQQENAMSAIEKLEQRLTALEAEVANLKEKHAQQEGQASGHPWLDRIYGAFANDPEYLEAMRLGRKYRESLRPKARKRTKRKAAHVDS